MLLDGFWFGYLMVFILGIPAPEGTNVCEIICILIKLEVNDRILTVLIAEVLYFL